MKILLGKRTGGAIFLILFIFIPVALLAAWLLWKICHWKPTFDRTGGNPELTNELTSVDSLYRQYGSNATVIVREFNLTLPIDALAYEWVYTVQQSSNLIDWTEINQDWDAVLEDISTNHPLPQMFFRRVLTY